ncbi:unnamed protein product [Arabis nemorensis]|uniref:Protease Do-like PDZ domain-containing protein n=1 Tax=Arabis nemorensis TaxID=586526 RepID=A0A565CR06_9BRAS|nr:unnamed protein product [Arabis nemorensis]
MSDEMTGALINQIYPLSNAHKILKEYDVILAIDDVPIGNDHSVPFRKEERVDLEDWLCLKRPGETTLVKVLRDGREHVFNINLNSKQPLLLEKFLPSYYILASFVFVPLSAKFLPSYKCSCISDRKPRKASEQVVIISEELEWGNFSIFENFEVKKVNGVEVVNLKHLSELIEKCCTEDLRFDLEQNKVIVLNTKSAKEATSSIIERFGIPSAMSKDLQRTNSGRVC